MYGPGKYVIVGVKDGGRRGLERVRRGERVRGGGGGGDNGPGPFFRHSPFACLLYPLHPLHPCVSPTTSPLRLSLRLRGGGEGEGVGGRGSAARGRKRTGANAVYV